MRLSDIMSAAGLAFYAEVALALFLLAFVAVVVTVVSRKQQQVWERARFMPLDDRPRARTPQGDERGRVTQ